MPGAVAYVLINLLIDVAYGIIDPRVQVFETLIIGGAHEVPVDRQGRILIPPKLREYAALDREVTFSARQDHFQLWDRQILEKVLKATEEKIMDPEFFSKLGL